MGPTLVADEGATLEVSTATTPAGTDAGLPDRPEAAAGVLPAQLLREAIAREWIVAAPWRIPADGRVGHYAGFFDPGFGYSHFFERAQPSA
jgi:hypothetical protein